jgi:hypothetical protein
MPHTYEPNPRHKQPWQPGARGTLCPRGADGAVLFETATQDPIRPGKRYNTDGQRAYCAHPNARLDPDDDQQHVVWHGFPVQWGAVPIAVQRQWVAEGRIPRVRLRG